MTTSGSYDFSLDRDGLISKAYTMVGAVAIGEDPTADELTEGGKTLNLMLKGWQTEGIALWLNQTVTLFLGYETQSYSTGPSGDHMSASIVKTEVATAASSGDTDILVDSIAGITNGDYLGIELDDGTVQWTTVNGVPSGSTIVAAVVLTDDVAVDNHIYTYTTKAQRPLDIIECRRVSADGNEVPLLQVSRSEYFSIADKASGGSVAQFYYDPQLTNGVLFVWPPSNNIQDILELTIKKPMMDLDSSADDGEFPVEWQDAIVSNLAVRIAIENGIEAHPGLKELAITSKGFAKEFDTEKDTGSYDPALDRDHLISEAYSLAGVVPIGSDPTIDELLDGIVSLNSMLKGWQTEGIGLWLNQEVTLFLGYETQSYFLGPSGDHMSASIVKTEVATAASSGDTDIIVDSITGITDGDYFGIELDDGTIQWTTVNGVPSGSTIVAAVVLTDDAAVNNHIYTYTTKAARPLEIVEGRRASADGIETPLLQISRSEYMALSDKSNSGITTQFYYDPQLTNGALFVWPTCLDVQDTLKLTIKKSIADFDAANTEGELPPEWRDAIISNLALRIAMKQAAIVSPDQKYVNFRVSPDLREFASKSKFMARTFDDEKTSIFFQPERR